MDKVLVLHFQFYIKGNLSDLDLFVHRSSKMQGGGNCDNSIKAATSHLHMDSPGDGMKCSLLSVLFRDFFLGKTFPSQVSQSFSQAAGDENISDNFLLFFIHKKELFRLK